MTEAFLCDAVRTPIGRYAGVLSSIRADDLGAQPIRALTERNPNVDWSAVERGPYDAHCGRLLAGRVNAETLDRIGTVLAAQPADNPLRQDAYRRAERHVAPRYRCVYGVR